MVLLTQSKMVEKILMENLKIFYVRSLASKGIVKNYPLNLVQAIGLMLFKNINFSFSVFESVDSSCVYGKPTRLHFNKCKVKHESTVLYIVHIDVRGPNNPPTLVNENFTHQTRYTEDMLIRQCTSNNFQRLNKTSIS